MYTERYARLLAWFNAHPAVKRAVIIADRWLPAVPFICYPLLLALLGIRLIGLMSGGPGAGAIALAQAAARAVFVPGAVFVGGTLLRKKLNFPRPYEQPGFVPLVQKETDGKSFPSRHALSATVLSMTWLWFYPAIGALMAVLALAICVLRVLTGVHYVRDVAAGAALGFVLGYLGMFVL